MMTVLKKLKTVIYEIYKNQVTFHKEYIDNILLNARKNSNISKIAVRKFSGFHSEKTFSTMYLSLK